MVHLQPGEAEISLIGAVKAAFPPLLVPIVGNGFVMGVLDVLIMEHLLYRTKLPTRTN